MERLTLIKVLMAQIEGLLNICLWTVCLRWNNLRQPPCIHDIQLQEHTCLVYITWVHSELKLYEGCYNKPFITLKTNQIVVIDHVVFRQVSEKRTVSRFVDDFAAIIKVHS